MCGIAGFADLTTTPGASLTADHGRVKAMCDAMRHRGPDDEGFYVEPGVALGMRRLSIIDLSTGHQPIHNEDGSRLGGLQRRDLQLPRAARGAGGAPATASTPRATPRRSSTATRSGANGVFARLRGMFGIALWDARDTTLLVARDRAGIKPLYYARGRRPPVLRLGGEVPAGESRSRSRARSGGARSLPGLSLHAARPRHLPRHAEAACRATC